MPRLRSNKQRNNSKKIEKRPSRPSKAQLLTYNNPARETFCQWVLSHQKADPDFLSNIMWTGESSFAPNGVTSNKNRFYWCREGELPPAFIEPEEDIITVHVWAGIHKNQIIGPVFIDGNLNSAKFLELLSGAVTEYIDDLPLNVRQKLWYQLNGLPAHSVPAARKRLSAMFDEQWIGRYGPVVWPSKSADLSPMELFLWEFVKRHVYAKRIKVCAVELKKSITSAFDKLKSMAEKSDLLNKERDKVLKQCQDSIREVNFN